MGKTYARVRVRKPGTRNGKGFEGDFLVDTGATDSVVPQSTLRRVGIRMIDRDEYELEDGSARLFGVGLAEFELEGRVTAGRVLSGPEKAEPILGLTILESLGLVVDAKRRKLRRGGPIALK
jgi:clan AA aspartic protease